MKGITELQRTFVSIHNTNSTAIKSTENEWHDVEYATIKKCCGGIIKASITWSLTGESGYKLYVNRISFNKTFETIDAAKIFADKFIHRRIMEYIETIKQNGDK